MRWCHLKKAVSNSSSNVSDGNMTSDERFESVHDRPELILYPVALQIFEGGTAALLKDIKCFLRSLCINNINLQKVWRTSVIRDK
jgi:hypothetical protein